MCQDCRFCDELGWKKNPRLLGRGGQSCGGSGILHRSDSHHGSPRSFAFGKVIGQIRWGKPLVTDMSEKHAMYILYDRQFGHSVITKSN